MKYSLGDFLLGVVHTFVIFAPGGLLLASILYAFGSDSAFSSAPPVFDSTAGWLLALIASYILGHFNSLVGSWIEDHTPITETYRNREVDPGVRARAEAILAGMSPTLSGAGSTRRTAAAMLRELAPDSFVEIERKDADRRFFRNTRIVFLIAAIVIGAAASPGSAGGPDERLAVVALAAFGLSWLRYRSQDRSYTRLVLETLVFTQRGSEKPGPAPRSREIRWFQRCDDEDGNAGIPRALLREFERFWRRGHFSARTDTYFRTGSSKRGVKLREGRIEVKEIVTGEELDANCKAECWEKRSGTRSDLSGDAIEVRKDRHLLKLIPGRGYEAREDSVARRSGATRFYPAGRNAIRGCQIELAEVRIGDRRYWTLGLEGFGPDACQCRMLAEARRWLSGLGDAQDIMRSGRCASYPDLLEHHCGTQSTSHRGA